MALIGTPGLVARASGPALAPVPAAAGPAALGSCDWPTYGGNPGRTMTTSCPSAPSPATVGSMLPKWHVSTQDVVTATPTVVGGVVYVGTGAGQFYTFDLGSGATRWSTTLGPRRTDGHADRHTGSYGTITSSAAVAPVGRRLLAFVGGGDSLYALDATASAVPTPTGCVADQPGPGAPHLAR